MDEKERKKERKKTYGIRIRVARVRRIRVRIREGRRGEREGGEGATDSREGRRAGAGLEVVEEVSLIDRRRRRRRRRGGGKRGIEGGERGPSEAVQKGEPDRSLKDRLRILEHRHLLIRPKPGNNLATQQIKAPWDVRGFLLRHRRLTRVQPHTQLQPAHREPRYPLRGPVLQITR
jgi:hypothetical protein